MSYCMDKLCLVWISVIAFYLYVILIHFPFQVYFSSEALIAFLYSTFSNTEKIPVLNS